MRAGQRTACFLDRGTIRVGIGVPSPADYALTAVDDPYDFASAAELSLFRRPLPATNLPFIPVVMWDGRVTGTSLDDALENQANAATQGHAQAPNPLPEDVRADIVAFEAATFNAQLISFGGGSLDAEGATGGGEVIAGQANVAGTFDLFDAWQNSNDAFRQSVYRGQLLFNTRDRTTGGGPCNGCHTTQNVGTNAGGKYFDVGVADGVNRTPDLPLYTFTSTTTGAVIQVTDPGRALISGAFKDIGKFKVPSLRGLSARAPYFHNGSAQTLLDVVQFYERSLAFSVHEPGGVRISSRPVVLVAQLVRAFACGKGGLRAALFCILHYAIPVGKNAEGAHACAAVPHSDGCKCCLPYSTSHISEW